MITEKRNRFGAYRENVAPENIPVQTVAAAQRAYAEHMAKMVPHQAPDAPTVMQKKRSEWLEKKCRLQTALVMAKNQLKIVWKDVK